MLVTAVEKGKGSRYNVFVEGEFALSLDVQTLISADLKAGQTVAPEDLDALRHSTDSRRARERALYLLDMRSHTQKELTDKLAKTVDADIARETAARMVGLGLVNDAEYARLLARELAKRKGWGASRIRQRLCEKGVDRDIVAEVLAELETEIDVQEILKAVILRKYQRFLGDKKGVDKTIAALMRLGYRYGDIRHALADIAQTDDELPDCYEE